MVDRVVDELKRAVVVVVKKIVPVRRVGRTNQGIEPPGVVGIAPRPVAELGFR
jgi:hypothetical protein